MIKFHETKMGDHFFNYHVPAAIKAINRLAEALEEANRLKKAEVEAKKDN